MHGRGLILVVIYVAQHIRGCGTFLREDGISNSTCAWEFELTAVDILSIRGPAGDALTGR